MNNSLYINVEQARAIEMFAPGVWTLIETPEGWVVLRGKAMLVGMNTKKPRFYQSLDRAIGRLKNEVGLRDFMVKALPPE